VLVPFDSRSSWRSALAAREDHARMAGPGLGATRATREHVIDLLDATRAAALVLDADALNVLAGDWRRLRAARAALVLTPHPGEAARLLGRRVGDDDRSRLAAAREISERSGAICCLKGRATVVASGERAYVNATGNAGHGDGRIGRRPRGHPRRRTSPHAAADSTRAGHRGTLPAPRCTCTASPAISPARASGRAG
jgi:NAD(P)H-hydrate repair Nnr-like enzyme with NAD(P)H-hydrate dehydratase domain